MHSSKICLSLFHRSDSLAQKLKYMFISEMRRILNWQSSQNNTAIVCHLDVTRRENLNMCWLHQKRICSTAVPPRPHLAAPALDFMIPYRTSFAPPSTGSFFCDSETKCTTNTDNACPSMFDPHEISRSLSEFSFLVLSDDQLYPFLIYSLSSKSLTASSLSWTIFIIWNRNTNFHLSILDSIHALMLKEFAAIYLLPPPQLELSYRLPFLL